MKYIIILIVTFLSSVRFASASVVILNGLTQTVNLESGQKISGKVLMRNDSPKPARVKIYTQDLMAACGQSINYLEVGNNPRSLGSWLTTGVDEKLLDPREEYALYYSITVPQNVVNAGTYWAVIMIEGVDPVKEEESEGMKVNSIVRYAIQVIGDLGKVESPKLSFEDIRFEGPANARILKFRIKNQGDFSTKTKVLLEIYDAKGEKIKTIEGLSKRIYPQLCNEFEIELSDLKKGKYEGIGIADNGKDLFGTNVSIEIE